MTYPAIKTDLKKLKARISQVQTRRFRAIQKNNYEMARMYEKDAKDLTKILILLKVENFKSAWSIIEWLDTAVRDEIPARLYNFIAKENGYC